MKKLLVLLMLMMLLMYTALAADTLDGGAEQASAVAVSVGGSYIDTIDATESEWFAFTADQDSAYYRVDLKNEETSAYLNMAIYDEQNVKLYEDDVYNGKTQYFSWKATPGMRYTIRTWFADKKAGGRMTLSVSKSPDIHGNDLTEASALELDSEIVSTLDGTSDVDVFAFTTLDGRNYYRLDFKNNDLGAYLNYELLDANGLKVQKDDVYTGKSAYISFKAEPGAQYYVKLYSAEKKQCGKYTIALSCMADNEPDTLETAAALTSGEASGSFDGTGDTDYFTFTAGEERAYYRLTLKNGTVDTTVYMEHQDAAGMKIKTLEAGKNKTSAYSFAAEAGATYYLKLTRSEKSKLGDYVITVEEYLDPMGDTPETALKMEDGVQLTGAIAGKEDIDCLSVHTGDMTMIRLTLENPTGNERMNVAVLDGSGAEVSSWRVDAGTTGEKTLELAPNAAYYVRVKCDQAGSFTILYATQKDLGGSDIASAMAIQAGEKIDLSFEMKLDADYVAFPEAGATIRVMATGERNILVTVVDENGMTLQGETRIYAGNSKAYVAERQNAYLKITGDDGAYSVQCCTESEHVRSEYFKTVTEATCSAEGLKEMYCLVCETVVDSEIIAKAAHTPADSFRVTKYAACDDAGLQVKKCVRCGETVAQEVIPATGHLNSHWEISLEDTCTENGIQRRVCSDCGKQLEQEIITALGHVTSDWTMKKYPTCADGGRQVRECRVCGTVLEEQIIPALGHQYGEWVVVKEATGSEEGLQQQVCQTCGDTQSQTIEKKGLFGGLFGD